MPSVISGSRALIVISDTTPLSELAKIGRLEILQEVYGRVVIPQEVFDEVTAWSHPAVNAIVSAKWIEIRPVGNPQEVLTLHSSTQLGLGECAAISLAEELHATRLLIDDLAARHQAQSRNLPVIGTVGVILVAKGLGVIPAVKDLLDGLVAHGTRIGQKLYQDALSIAGE
jgi:hypothetical protein